MKKYNCGLIEIKNVEILRNELNKLGEDFEIVGIQSSLKHLDEYTEENVEEIIFDGFENIEQNNNIKTRVYEFCSFILPLFSSYGVLIGFAKVEGTGIDIREIDEQGNEEDLEVYFNITNVKIAKEKILLLL